MKHQLSLRKLAIVLALAATLPARAQSEADLPPKSLTAPDGSTSVRIIEKAMPGTDGISDFFTLEVLRGSNVILREPTEGYLVSASWSADGGLVAVTNRRGNSGDYLWVIDLEKARTLKRPDDKTGDAWVKWALAQIRRKAPSQASGEPMKYWLVGDDWAGGRTLRFNLRARYQSGAAFDAAGLVDFSSGKPGKPADAKVAPVE